MRQRMNHWEQNCVNKGCGHRKGSHSVEFGKSRRVTIGHCLQCARERGSSGGSGPCIGFSDGKLWKDGKQEGQQIAKISSEKSRPFQPSGAIRAVIC